MSDVIEPIAAPEPRPDNLAASELAGKSFDITEMKMKGYFGANNPTTEESKFLSEIARNLGTGDDVDLLWEIKNLENRIGTPPLGMSRLQHVYNFMRINSQIQGLERERDLYVQ